MTDRDPEVPNTLTIATAVYDELSELEVVDDAMAEKWNTLLRDAKGRASELEEKRKAATAPLNKSLKEINSWFKPAQEKLGALEALLKRGLNEYVRRREIEAQASMKRVEEQARQGGTPEGLTAAIEAIVEPPAPLAGFSSREVWAAEVVDAAKVPREYCSPDPKLVAALAKEANEDELSPEDVADVLSRWGIRLFKRTIATRGA